MPFRKRISAAPILAVLLLAAACSQSETVAAPKQDAAERLDADARKWLLENSGDERSKPAFSKETTIKLNGIVRRSLDSLDAFDQLAPQLQAARASGDTAQVDAISRQLADLEAKAVAARTDFQAAKAELLASKEPHNTIVLDAMEQFVLEAPDEIAEAIAAKPPE